MMAGGTMLQEGNHLRSKEIVARGASPIWTTLPPRSVADPCFRGATQIELVPPQVSRSTKLITLSVRSPLFGTGEGVIVN